MDRTSITLHQAKKGIEKLIHGVSDVLPATNVYPVLNSKMSDRTKKCVLLLIFCIITTYLVLDYNLLVSVKSGSLFNQAVAPDQWYSPFYPLSVKLLVSAHSSQYVTTPLASYFNRITRFSEIFTFVTPNMVTITHLLIAIICFKFFASDSLRMRRIGVLLFEIKIFLDSLDGVIFRARSNKKLYTSDRSQFGYHVDVVSDILGGVALYGSLMYYYLKNYTNLFTNYKLVSNTTSDTDKIMSPPSKRLMVSRFVCVGFFVLFASFTWDRTIQAYETVLQTPTKDSKIQALQTDAFRETGTFIILVLWKILEGEELLQMTMFAVFLDKTWEFFWYLQYIGITFLIILNIVTMWHLNYLKNFIDAGKSV